MTERPTTLDEHVENILRDRIGGQEITGLAEAVNDIVNLLSLGAPVEGETRAEIHGRVTRAAIFNIIGPILMTRGSVSDIMVAGESLLVGIALSCVKLGGDDRVLDVMFAGAKERLTEMRLADIETGGQA